MAHHNDGCRVNPELLWQTRRNPWPYNGDNATDRARKIALMYRAHLNAENPDLCSQADRTAINYGETWVTPQLATFDDTDEVTTSEAAELVNVTEHTIRDWACTPHPERPDVMLLPRFGWRGRSRTYLAGKVREAAGVVMRARNQRVNLTRSGVGSDSSARENYAHSPPAR